MFSLKSLENKFCAVSYEGYKRDDFFQIFYFPVFESGGEREGKRGWGKREEKEIER